MSGEDRLTPEERNWLLEQARYSIDAGVKSIALEALQLNDFPPRLREPGVTFVTLTIDGKLRGCVGALEAYQALIEDVREHALGAALNDYRFPQVRPEELEHISIEISRLTTPKELDYESPEDLLNKLRPGIDGVVLKVGLQRATFLPQVWGKLATPVIFLEHLCQKMNKPADLWRQQKLDVLIYQVEEFHE